MKKNKKPSLSGDNEYSGTNNVWVKMDRVSESRVSEVRRVTDVRCKDKQNCRWSTKDDPVSLVVCCLCGVVRPRRIHQP